MPHDIFISYSRRDLAAVKPIKEELERLGFSCWMDLEGIESGSEEFTECIVSAIGLSSCFLFFLSTSSQSSEWSLKELRFAKASKKRVVLVRFNNDDMTPVFSFNFGGSDIIDWRIPEQTAKLVRDLSAWTGKGTGMGYGGQAMPSPEPDGLTESLKSGIQSGEDSVRTDGARPVPHPMEEKEKSIIRKATFLAVSVSVPLMFLMFGVMSEYESFGDCMEVFWILLPPSLFPIVGLFGAVRAGTVAMFPRRMWMGFAFLAIISALLGVFCNVMEMGESGLIGTFCFAEPVTSFILARRLFWKKPPLQEAMPPYPSSSSWVKSHLDSIGYLFRFVLNRIRSAF